MGDLDIRKINKNIKILEKLESDGYLDISFALKLSLMECCGWIEEKFHCIIFSFIDKNITNKILQKETKAALRKKNYGFKYRHFKEKLVAILGEAKVIKIETLIDKYDNSKFDFQHFKQILTELKKERDWYAHTYSRISSNRSNGMGFSEIKEKTTYINKGLRIIEGFVRRS